MMIMETLPKSFFQFKSNYVMNKLSFNLTQLLNELTIYESMMIDKPKPSSEANIDESSKSAKMKKKKNKKSSKETKPKGKCFYYNKDGHWKSNCPKYLAELKEKKNSGK